MSEPDFPLIDIIAGARPNFMKIAPIIHALETRKAAGGRLRYRLIHTGQHYDARMSGEFFTQLNIPAPDINLEVGSGTQAEQTGMIMARYEKVCLERRADLCLVVGDVTSTMACSITAAKLGLSVAHVEAGIRSGDRSMPEEINRLVTDVLSAWFFTTSETANDNLREAGVKDERIFFVGNTMIDTLYANLQRLRPPAFVQTLDLQPQGYFVLTLHRPSNVDDPEQLFQLIQAMDDSARGLPVIFPVHPRTRKSLEQLPAMPSGLHLVEPQPYLEFNHLVRNSKAVVTDSGGVTEEATVLGVPCMTLRDSTERPETVTLGTNELLGSSPAALKAALKRLFETGWKKGGIPPMWDGHTGPRIVSHLEELL